ncbi:MAG: hypothetical protein WA726_04540 [Acidimicrobiia bacterium]
MKSKILIALIFVLAACSGQTQSGGGVASLDDSSGTSTTTTIAQDADPEAAAMAFTQCMRDNGVEMEDPTVDGDGNVIPGRPTNLPQPGSGGQDGPGGAFGEELRSAFEACGDLLSGTAFGFTPEDLTAIQDQLLEFAQCLRDQGLDVADPDLSNLAGGGDGGGRGRGLFGLDFQDPDVQTAVEACQDHLPNVGGLGGFGRPGGTPPAGSGG